MCANNNPNKTARIAGALYLLLVPLGILGLIYVPKVLTVPGDIAATARNILANETLFRLSMVSELLVQVVNIAVVLYLFKLLKPVNRTAARLMVLFILLGLPIAMFNVVNHAAALTLLQEGSPSYGLVALFLELHTYGIHIAGIFWGLWLFPMGYLVYKSGFLPKVIGILLMIGCCGYLFDSFAFFLLPSLGFTVSQFTFVGELLLPLWLLIVGVKRQPRDELVLKPAA